MFGPLNGVRTALVILAAVAGLIALGRGQVLAGSFILGAVALHGAGWWYLWRSRPEA